MIDPIYAAIERARLAADEDDRLIHQEPLRESPQFAKWEAANNAAIEASVAADRALVATVPTTLTGLAALVRYVKERSDMLDMYGAPGSNEKCSDVLLDTIAMALEYLDA